MSRSGRVLVVDDQERWREVLGEALERGGYHYEAVSSAAVALERLQQQMFHILVLDIRLDDADQSNTEGMQILRSLDRFGGTNVIKVIMLSAYGTREQMREAFRDHGIVDFLSKEDFDDDNLLVLIGRVLGNDLRINLALDVNWQRASGPEEVVQGTYFADTRVKRDDPALLRRAAEELDDLLCRLFYKANAVLIERLTPGHSGAGVLRTQPVYNSGSARNVVVKFGRSKDIKTESKNFDQYVRPFVGGGRSTTVYQTSYTPRMGGIVYSLLGNTSERFDSFESFYQRADILQIQTVLRSLFLDTCRAWYENLGVRQIQNLTSEYLDTLGYQPELLEQTLSQRLSKSVQGKQKLQFRALDDEQTFTNPIFKLYEPPLRYTTYRCITHGDLNAQNALVDADRHIWLIDFLRTGPGHILRDVTQLDTVIRIQLLEPGDATLQDRYLLEKTLAGAQSFSQIDQLPADIETNNVVLNKTYQTSLELRRIASQLLLHNDDIIEYNIGSFFHTLNMIRFHNLPIVQREHALLAASLATDQI